MQQKCVPQKNSQNRSGGESSFLLRPEDDVSQARSATSREPERARKTTYWDDNGSERWLPWTGYLVPMRTYRFKKKASLDAECLSTTELRPPSQSIPAWTPNHPAKDGPYMAIPPASGSAGPLAAYVGTI
ncbi:hypothetical protein E2C01_079664 [Portunus trituberculatus]|uniref:Uncharacterized protein n=1 Tax=Portunus trituberculatus TaxID=210409 RepID=A0A5B7IM34_PORTR|nr:hypothetical protein [Portunus trituberculatus]